MRLVNMLKCYLQNSEQFDNIRLLCISGTIFQSKGLSFIVCSAFVCFCSCTMKNCIDNFPGYSHNWALVLANIG